MNNPYRSEKIGEVIKMIIAVRPQLLCIPPDKKSNRGDYISRDQLLREVNTILAPLGGQVIPTGYRGEWGFVQRIILSHGPSEQWISSEYTLDEHMDFSQGDVNQKKGGSITYGIRYNLGSMLGIPIGDDDAPSKPQGKPITADTLRKLNDLYDDAPALKLAIMKQLDIDDFKVIFEHEVNQVIKYYKDHKKP